MINLRKLRRIFTSLPPFTAALQTAS